MRLKLIAGSIAAVGLIGISNAFAADTNTLTVTASITGTCKFNSSTSTLAFGGLDQSLATNPSASTTTQYWCTTGTVASVSADNGLHPSGTTKRMLLTTGTDVIPYTLTLSGGAQTGAGKTSPLTLTLNGSIANADYVNVSAGSYSDTVTLSITP